MCSGLWYDLTGRMLPQDFTIPSSWRREIPEDDIITFYYCRLKSTCEEVFAYLIFLEIGSLASDVRPFLDLVIKSLLGVLEMVLLKTSKT